MEKTYEIKVEITETVTPEEYIKHLEKKIVNYTRWRDIEKEKVQKYLAKMKKEIDNYDRQIESMKQEIAEVKSEIK